MADENDTGTDLEVIPDSLPAVERAIEDVQEQMKDTYTYARSPRVQARAAKLYEASERLQGEAPGGRPEGAGEQAVTLSGDDVSTALQNLAGLGTIGAQWADELGHGENARNALQVGEDQRVKLLAAMGDTADAVAMAFEGLNDNVQVAVYRELHNTYAPALPPADAEDLAVFAGLDHGAVLTKEWAGETGRRLAVALHRWNRMIQYLDEGEQGILHDFFHQPAHGFGAGCNCPAPGGVRNAGDKDAAIRWRANPIPDFDRARADDRP